MWNGINLKEGNLKKCHWALDSFSLLCNLLVVFGKIWIMGSSSNVCVQNAFMESIMFEYISSNNSSLPAWRKKHELCFHDWNHDDNDKDDDDEDGDFNWTRGWEILSLRIDQLINDKTRTMSRSTLTVQSPWLSSQNSPATVPMYFTCNDAHDYFQWFFYIYPELQWYGSYAAEKIL